MNKKNTTTTTSNGRFTESPSSSKTFYKTNGAKTQAIDLGGSKVLITIPTFISIFIGSIVFVCGIVWFIAGNWVFSNKCEDLKIYIKEITASKESFDKNQEAVNEIQKNIDCLKNKKFFSVDCFKK